MDNNSVLSVKDKRIIIIISSYFNIDKTYALTYSNNNNNKDLRISINVYWES